MSIRVYAFNDSINLKSVVGLLMGNRSAIRRTGGFRRAPLLRRIVALRQQVLL